MATDLLEVAGRGRALQAADLVVDSHLDVGGQDSTVDDAELAGRVRQVEASLRELLVGLTSDDPATLTAALVQCVVAKVPGALNALQAAGIAQTAAHEVAGGEPSEDLVGRVVAALDARLAGPSTDGLPDDTKVARPGADPKAWARVAPQPLAGDHDTDPHGPEGHIARLRHLSGWSLPILPVVTLPADPDRTVSLQDERLQREVAEHGHRWLRTVGMVRAEVESLVLAGHMVAGAGRDPLGDLAVMQLPADGSVWAARGPSGVDRTCVLSLTGADWMAAERAAGLLVDGWSEGIPRRQVQTGIAVHFDAPSARPPSAVLVSVVGADRAYSTDEFFDQLRHVIDLAKIRTVGPDRLVGIGQAMPAVYLPDGLSARAEEASP